MKHAVLFICILSLIILVYPGCAFFKMGASSNPAVSTEPLTGNWAMTRASIEPPLPSVIPGFVVDQLFPKSITWTISLSASKLAVKYGGKPIWFNPLGFNVATRPVSAAESADKKSCTFSGGGDIKADALPGVLSMISAAAGNPKNISIGYTDQVKVTMIAEDQIKAVITYSASGSYTNNKGPGSINNASTLTYTGKRK